MKHGRYLHVQEIFSSILELCEIETYTGNSMNKVELLIIYCFFIQKILRLRNQRMFIQ